MPPKTAKLEVSRSIQMSYGRALGNARFSVGSGIPVVKRKTERSGNVRHTAAQSRHNLRRIARPILAIGTAGLAVNEVRGAILAVPTLIGMAQANTWMAVWVGFCSLAGIAASVFVPIVIWRKVTT